MLRIIIIDDESNSREILRTFLNKYCTDLEIVGEADSVESGLELITSQESNLIFLDIEMVGGNGFELLDRLPDNKPLICFVTGYDQYAIKAIKYKAFDYLLKPLDIEELKTVVSKARLEVGNHNSPSKLILNEAGKFNIIEYAQITHISVNGNYCLLHRFDKKSVISNENLSFFEQKLPLNQFVRIHKSYIVNLDYIQEVKLGRTGLIQLKTGIELNIASRRKRQFVELMESYGKQKDTLNKY